MATRSTLTVILHADVAGSTALVQMNESIAHERIRDSFKRLSNAVSGYGGTVHELRGDAVVAEFDRASDAVCAALVFQAENSRLNEGLADEIRPQVRLGVALGEVVIADGTLTGAGVVLAQRLEQLASPGGVVLQGAVAETVPVRFPFDFENLGDKPLKGFEQPVRAFAVALASGASIPMPDQEVQRDIDESARADAPGLPSKPSLAVLPFQNLSGDPEQDYFSDGITEDIITELSRFPTLFVIARHSSFSVKGQGAGVGEVAERLGVKYIAQGSVRKVGPRVRVNVRLVEALTGRQIWSERYDRSITDIFAVQDEVAQTIVSALVGRVERAELVGAERKPTSSLTAYEYFVRGNAYFYQLTRDGNLEARKMFEAALAQDPIFARAHARLGATYNVEAYLDHNSEASLSMALEAVNKGLAIDPEDSWVHESLGFVHLRSGRFDEAEEAFDKVLELNPNDADSIAWAAQAFCRLGRSQEAINLIRKAMRLNPLHPDSYHRTLGHALYLSGDYAGSVKALKLGGETGLGGWRQLFLSIAFAQLGRFEESAEEMRRFLTKRRSELGEQAAAPALDDMGLAMEIVYQHRHAVDREHLLDGLSKTRVLT